MSRMVRLFAVFITVVSAGNALASKKERAKYCLDLPKNYLKKQAKPHGVQEINTAKKDDVKVSNNNAYGPAISTPMMPVGPLQSLMNDSKSPLDKQAKNNFLLYQMKRKIAK